MYKLVYNTFATPAQLQHALDVLAASGVAPQDVRLAVSADAEALLNGKLVEPEVPEPAEGEEAASVPPAAPAFDELDLKLWQRQKAQYGVLVADGSLADADDTDRQLLAAYGTYLAKGRILVILKEWSA